MNADNNEAIKIKGEYGYLNLTGMDRINRMKDFRFNHNHFDGNQVRAPQPHTLHGLKTLALHRSISLTLRVTTINPWAIAVAAIRESITGSFTPFCSVSP
jgi:hypothetical protein